jgi:hypothetical protein
MVFFVFKKFVFSTQDIRRTVEEEKKMNKQLMRKKNDYNQHTHTRVKKVEHRRTNKNIKRSAVNRSVKRRKKKKNVCVYVCVFVNLV